MRNTLPLFALGAALAGAAGAQVGAQFRGCALDDYRCLEDLYWLNCAEVSSTVDSCRSLADDLRRQFSTTPTTAIGEVLGSTLYRLAGLAEDKLIASADRAEARQVSLDVVARDSGAGNALLTLAILEEESADTRLGWMRRAHAADPNWIRSRSLVSALLVLGTPEALREAVAVVESDYTRAALGEEKWRSAASALGTYEFVERIAPGVIGPDWDDAFLARIRQDSDWESVLRVLGDQSAETEAYRASLDTACHLIPVFGDETCIRGIESAVAAATDAPASREAQPLADAAAQAIAAMPRDSSIVLPDTRTPRQLAWLDHLLANGLDSRTVLDATASVSRDRARRLAIRQEIVSRFPDSGQARFDLGKMYFDADQWEAARTQLLLARELLPSGDELQFLLTQYLRQADYLANGGVDMSETLR